MTSLVSKFRASPGSGDVHNSGCMFLELGEANLVSEMETFYQDQPGGKEMVLAGSIPPSVGTRQGRAGQCKAWTEKLPSSASGHAWLPNWLSLRLLFIQIRQGSGFADQLRFLSHAHWLANLIFELQTQRYSFEMEHFCGVHGYPGVIVSKTFPCSFRECGYLRFVWPFSSGTSSRDAFL